MSGNLLVGLGWDGSGEGDWVLGLCLRYCLSVVHCWQRERNAQVYHKFWGVIKLCVWKMNPSVLFKQSVAFSVNVCVLINSWSGMALQTENVHLSAASTFLEKHLWHFQCPQKSCGPKRFQKHENISISFSWLSSVHCLCHSMGWLKKRKDKMKSISSKVDIFWHFNSFLEAVSHSSRTPQKMGNIWLPSPLGQLGHPLIFVACQTG